jgi:hypothetical protein
MGSRSDPERAEVRSIIEQVFSDRFSGRAGQPRIFGVVWPLLNVGLREYLARKGLKSEIGLYLREQRPEDGLPQKVAARAQVLYDVAIDVDDPFDEATAS